MPLFAKRIEVVRSNPLRWGYCRACRARIEWVTTLEKRKPMPVDWPLVALETHEGSGRIITTIDAKQCHFATCAFADEFRKEKRAAGVKVKR